MATVQNDDGACLMGKSDYRFNAPAHPGNTGHFGQAFAVQAQSQVKFVIWAALEQPEQE